MSDQSKRGRLLAEESQLTSAIAEFEHQIRRIRDRLERSGGRSPLVEAELEQAERNLAVNLRELKRVRNLLDRHATDEV